MFLVFTNTAIACNKTAATFSEDSLSVKVVGQFVKKVFKAKNVLDQKFWSFDSGGVRN